jgi:hypothetical protein
MFRVVVLYLVVHLTVIAVTNSLGDIGGYDAWICYPNFLAVCHFRHVLVRLSFASVVSSAFELFWSAYSNTLFAGSRTFQSIRKKVEELSVYLRYCIFGVVFLALYLFSPEYVVLAFSSIIAPVAGSGWLVFQHYVVLDKSTRLHLYFIEQLSERTPSPTATTSSTTIDSVEPTPNNRLSLVTFVLDRTYQHGTNAVIFSRLRCASLALTSCYILIFASVFVFVLSLWSSGLFPSLLSSAVLLGGLLGGALSAYFSLCGNINKGLLVPAAAMISTTAVCMQILLLDPNNPHVYNSAVVLQSASNAMLTDSEARSSALWAHAVGYSELLQSYVAIGFVVSLGLYGLSVRQCVTHASSDIVADSLNILERVRFSIVSGVSDCWKRRLGHDKKDNDPISVNDTTDADTLDSTSMRLISSAGSLRSSISSSRLQALTNVLNTPENNTMISESGQNNVLESSESDALLSYSAQRTAPHESKVGLGLGDSRENLTRPQDVTLRQWATAALMHTVEFAECLWGIAVQQWKDVWATASSTVQRAVASLFHTCGRSSSNISSGAGPFDAAETQPPMVTLQQLTSFGVRMLLLCCYTPLLLSGWEPADGSPALSSSSSYSTAPTGGVEDGATSASATAPTIATSTAVPAAPAVHGSMDMLSPVAHQYFLLTLLTSAWLACWCMYAYSLYCSHRIAAQYRQAQKKLMDLHAAHAASVAAEAAAANNLEAGTSGSFEGAEMRFAIAVEPTGAPRAPPLMSLGGGKVVLCRDFADSPSL